MDYSCTEKHNSMNEHQLLDQLELLLAERALSEKKNIASASSLITRSIMSVQSERCAVAALRCYYRFSTSAILSMTAMAIAS